VRLFAAMILCLLALCVGAESAFSAPPPETAPAASELAGCVQRTNRLSVLVLMDESGSLAVTDPKNQRVEGLRAALAGLAHVASSSSGGPPPAVEVLFLGFYGKVDPAPSSARWLAVNASSLTSLDEQAGIYATHNFGQDTDFGTALLAARQLLAEHAAELARSGGPEPCKALIWFTDGGYEITSRSNSSGLPLTVPYAPHIVLNSKAAGQQAVAAGKHFLCRPAGFMDGLESDNVIKFTVGLGVQMSPEDSAFLSAATTGSGPGTSCGSRLSPQTGEYLHVANANGLFFAFGDLLEGANTPITATGTCPLKPCQRGSSSFRSVPGLSRFRIRASTGANGIEIVLRSPTGQAIHLSDAAAQETAGLPGTSISERWLSPQTVEVEGNFSASSGQWVGPWSFSFVAPQGGDTAAVPLSTIRLYADAIPALVGPRALVRGESSPLTIALEQQSGQRAPASALVRSAILTADATDPVTGHISQVPVTSEGQPGLYGVNITVPAASEAPFLLFNVTARFPAVDGVSVAPAEGAFRLPVHLPAHQGYPTVSPLQLQLAPVSGKAKTTGFLTITASTDAPGCFWIAPARVLAPEEAGSLAVTTAPVADSAAGCIHLAKGETKRVAVAFEPARAATGTVHASLPVVLLSGITPGSRTMAIQATFGLYPPPNVAKRVWLTVLLTLIGILIPLLLLHGLNVAGARFTEPQKLQWLAQDVEINPSTGLQLSGGGQIKSRFGDFEEVTGQGVPHKERSLQIDRFELRAIASGSFHDRVFHLLRGPYAVAEAEGEPLLAGAGQPLRVWRGGTEHEVPLALPGTWLFLPTSVPTPASDILTGEPGAPEPVAGRLLLLIADHDQQDRGTELAQSAGAALRAHDWSSFTAAPEPQPTHSSLFARLFPRRNADEQSPTIPGEEDSSTTTDDSDSWTPTASPQDPAPDEPDSSSHIY
jgi:hypothetical protein